MAFEPLHKNTGSMARDWRIGRLFVSVNVAEDPAKPLLLRNWAKQEGRTQRDVFFDISRVTYEYEDGSRQKSVNVIVGPLSLWLAIFPARSGSNLKS